ncbi:unnamed protein product [Darwinula stevensoni]|uniref:Plasminogen n=1 Tax=Darwinula stevensoni TaxID=69355 RepID=A0A7R8ZZU0_9CRUS|nr:unnamed protein product [Darwinula stevensoni]CAG0883224.1 unnamed protein product [Darwinula stevensoni]
MYALCLTDYPRIENAEESVDGWRYPAPPGGKVIFTCRHPRGFSNGFKEHKAKCSSVTADAWCTTFTQSEKYLCPHPLSCVTEHPKIENVSWTYDRWDGKYPAPPGATIIYTCHQNSRFTDGSLKHNATCSFLPDDAWDTSFHGNNVRCRDEIVYPECQLTEMGKEYVGTVNVTKSGSVCLRWDSPTVESSFRKVGEGFDPNMFYDEHFLYQDSSLHKNFCRNPTLNTGPWCFIERGGLTWETCSIPFCDDRRAPECKVTQMGAEYIGARNRTLSGSPCLSWLSMNSVKEGALFAKWKQTFPDSITTDHNYCRNPDGKMGGPWCTVSDAESSEESWGYCDVRVCEMEKKETTCEMEGSCQPKPMECKLTNVGDEYIGVMNVVANVEIGPKKCQSWLSQATDEDVTMPSLETFPDPAIDSGHNYCRNPNRDPNGPWCYTEYATGSGRQYCEVPFCFEAYERSAVDGNPAKEYPECLQTEIGKEYVGTVRKTRTGKSCLKWSSMNSSFEFFRDLLDFDRKIAYDGHFRFGKAALHQDFCRNPTLKERPWCFVNISGEWDYCDIPYCPTYSNKTECRWTQEGEEYAGTRNVTFSGSICLSWSASKLYKRYWPRFPEDVKKINHNFCRNPNGTTTSGGLLKYYAVHPGQRYGNASRVVSTRHMGQCNVLCTSQIPIPCNAYNYRSSDGSCELIMNDKSSLVPSQGYQAYVQKFCLTEYPRVDNAMPTYKGWDGKYPASSGAYVILTCDQGFTDGKTEHRATCSDLPDSWCTSFLLGEYPECRKTEKGKEYIGTMKKTETGKDCLRWDSKPYGKPKDFSIAMLYEEHFLNEDVESAENYCRNPALREKPWCFVSDPNITWEFCDIPKCMNLVPLECKLSQKGAEYMGIKSRTLLGMPCMPWLELPLSLQYRRWCLRLPAFSDEVNEEHNYCRNPGGRPAGPWCYFGDGVDDWGYCDVPFCPQLEKKAAACDRYAGHLIGGNLNRLL